MTRYVWELPGADAPCDSYAPGHQIFWGRFNQSMRQPGDIIPVTASVDDDGVVHIEGDGLSLVRWNHEPALLRTALERFGGMADWKPRWSLLAVPTAMFIGGRRTVFSLAELNVRRECHVPGTPNRKLTDEELAAERPHLRKLWAEQEAKNAALRAVDHSHIPPLRIAERYADGKRPGTPRG